MTKRNCTHPEKFRTTSSKSALRFSLACTFCLCIYLLVNLISPSNLLAQEGSRSERESEQLESLPLHRANQREATVVRVFYGNAQRLNALRAEYDVWEEAVSKQPFVTILASAAEVEALRAAGYRVDVARDLTASLHQEAHLFGQNNSQSSGQDNGPDHGVSAAGMQTIPNYSCYRTVEETYASLSQLAANNPTLVTWTDIGDSWDKETAGGPTGYDIYALKLTNSAIAGPKPPLMIIAAIHAREYTTAEMATRLVEHLVANYGTDPDITWLLDYHEIHILPQSNPDGRKIAEGGIYWRKNRNPTNGCSGGNSYGVDLNRNSGFQWGNSGSSGNTCNQTYRGPSPVSEPEVQTIQNYAASVFADQRGPGLNDPAPVDTEGVFITIHSYSELVLYPWHWSDIIGPNEANLATLGRKFGFHNGYEVCNDCLYLASGVTDDWTYGELGVASYTFELGTEFFQQCSIFENTIYPNNLPAFIYAAKAARRPYQTALGPEAINLMLDAVSVNAGALVTVGATIDDTRYDSNGHGNEPTQAIQAARYSIDLPSWKATTLLSMNAADGSFDSTVEDVTGVIDTTGLPSGTHTIFIEGQDVAGNWGVPTAIYLDIVTPAPGLVTQIGPFDATSSTSPLFEWRPDAVATAYKIAVYDRTNGTVILFNDNSPYSASMICTGADPATDTCSVQPSITLVPGVDYLWLVQAWNNTVNGPWSIYP